MFPKTTLLRRLSAARPPSRRRLVRDVHQNLAAETARRQRNSNPVSHGTENYFVDGDETPPPADSLFRVDPTSDAAESAYEPPTGPWSRAGAGTEAYRTVSEDQPYDVPGGADVKTRYGGTKRYMEDDKEDETSKAREGPKGTGCWGRKSEGRGK